MKNVLIFLAKVLLVSSCSQEPETDKIENASKSEEHVNTITVYSSRAEHLIKPLFDRFTESTGIPVQYITDKEAALITRLKTEGARTPADLLLTVDAGNLWFAETQKVLQSVESDTLESQIPAHMRSANNQWFGLSARARTIIYAPDRVDETELMSYEGLADEKWRERLCLRTSKKVYNQSLVASMIIAKGETKTQNVVEGWVANLAIPPLSNDTKAIQAVKSGICDLTIVNTYYFGRLLKEQPDLPLKIYWPNQDGRGVHVNVSGIGLTKYAQNSEEAIQLMEWLSSPEAQGQFAGVNMEYPVNPEVEVIELVKSWGEFVSDSVSLTKVGELQQTAIKLMDRAGYL